MDSTGYIYIFIHICILKYIVSHTHVTMAIKVKTSMKLRDSGRRGYREHHREDKKREMIQIQ